MVDIKRFAMAGGAMITAAAIGFVMQSGPAAQKRYTKAQAPDISGTASDPLTVTDIKLTSAVAGTSGVTATTPESPIVQDAVAQKQTDADAHQGAVQVAALTEDAVITDAPAELAPSEVCEVAMAAQPMPAAMADVSLTAACLPNERVTIHHNGMMFTDVTDANGTLSVVVPALTKNAIFIAAFANGEGALASATIDDLDKIDRKVIQSKASGHLMISAYEYGAEFRQDGHVTANAERSMDVIANGDGGYVTRLGDAEIGEALVAEVYSFPTKTAKRAGDIAVVVEAEVTTDNCGLRIEAQTLEVSAGGRLKVQDLTLPIPACDAVGDFLVLQNLLGDLKVARN